MIRFLVSLLFVILSHASGECDGKNNKNIPQVPHVIIVSSLTCPGCYQFMGGKDHEKIKELAGEGLITLEYFPFIHDNACLVGASLAASNGGHDFAKNYLFLLEKQKEWIQGDWKENLEKIARTQMNLSPEKVGAAFRENSDIQNNFILKHIAFTKRYEIKFIPCILVNDKIIDAEYDKISKEPVIKELIEALDLIKRSSKKGNTN